jgi:hypothetical protein
MSTDPRPLEADGEASPDVERELTDEELAAATGGMPGDRHESRQLRRELIKVSKDHVSGQRP